MRDAFHFARHSTTFLACATGHTMHVWPADTTHVHRIRLLRAGRSRRMPGMHDSSRQPTSLSCDAESLHAPATTKRRCTHQPVLRAVSPSCGWLPLPSLRESRSARALRIPCRMRRCDRTPALARIPLPSSADWAPSQKWVRQKEWRALRSEVTNGAISLVIPASAQ